MVSNFETRWAGAGNRRTNKRLGSAALVLVGLTANLAAGADDPNALWRIVHEQCVPHLEQFGTPLPCVAVIRSAGSAVLKDRNGASQFLLIPTARLSGIEDPALLAPDAPNYWQAAWESTNLVEAMVGRPLPRDTLSLAVNSAQHRSQNQFHIHIDCISSAVRAALREHGAEIGDAWAPFPVPLASHAYRAVRIRTLVQPGATPFLMLNTLADARSEMTAESLVAVGATFDGETGFYLLETRLGGGEELQDHGCTVAGLQ